MPRLANDRSRGWRAAVIGAVALLGAPLLAVQPAYADSAPEPPVPTRTVTADELPTVQIDGVAYDQLIVGNRVYVTGRFAQARPAGAAPGTNQTARSNILAYDLTTGALITNWAPALNGQGLTLDASADGSRIYVGGEFTQVNGTTRNRIAALDSATGALVNGFNPNANTRVRSIDVVGSTVYLGGNFTTVGGQPRTRIAAVNASTGALTPWAPNLSAEVFGVVVPEGTGLVVAGGRFQFANDVETQGLAALSVADASLQPWAAYRLMPNYGPDSAIYSLATDGAAVYGTAYDYFGPSPFEGTFSAEASSGRIRWLTGCLGDTYDVAPVGDVVYNVSHAHDCGMIGGNPETSPRSYQWAQALATAPPADGRVNTYGAYGGQPAPELLHWQPTFASGSFTGQKQAGWTITGNSEYVLIGGEFPRVNGVAQQGLVRFRVNGPNQEGPQGTTDLTPTTVSLAPGAVRVAWKAAWDRDNRRLTYEVLRGATLGTSTVIATVAADSAWWERRALAFTDTGAAPGSTQVYRVRAKDAFGNTVVSATTQAVVQDGVAQPGPYADAVRADGAVGHWRLGEPAGTALAYDWAGGADLAVDGSAGRGAPGPLQEDNPATTFTGTATVPATSSSPQAGPQTLSVEAWFRTTSGSGGKIVGFGNSTTGDSTSYDRHVYMSDDGRVTFGVYTGSVRTLTTAGPLNDGQWHHVVGTLGPAGMELFVDGQRAGRRTDTTSAQPYSGYWRVGGDSVGGWPGQPSNTRFTGDIDEVAVYPTPLALDRVQAHFAASGRTAPTGTRPTDAYGQAVYDAAPESYWRLDETAGGVADDTTAAGADGVYAGGTVLGVPGVVGGAAQLDGVDDVVTSSRVVENPTVYSEELWFSTTTTRGGKLIGFGRAQTGSSSSYDRHVYMFDDGRLRFGAYDGNLNVADSAQSYNDGRWHHLVATQGADGMKLYVDGVQVASNPATRAESYPGYWRVGGDNTWGGASSDYFAGTVDEVAVYSSVLTPAQVADHYVRGGGAGGNTPPSASFTNATDGLAASFDATASADADGTITTYSWDFGDGTTGTGATVQHSYTAAGTYSVALTVTDDDGATGTSAAQVTVAAPPPGNTPPTAAFTAATSGLTATFDASASADADGTVANHVWDFGDGTTGSGATAAHTYAAPGAYRVQLTVTDDDAATGTAAQDITLAAAPGGFVADAFSRTVSGGLGGADLGGPWTVSGGPAADYSVADGAARFRLPAAAAQRTGLLNGVAQTDVELALTTSLDEAATGGGVFVSAVGRRVGTSGDYRVKVLFAANGTVQLRLSRTVGTTETTLATTTLPGVTYTPGAQLRVELQVGGTGTTALAAKAWLVGSPEPATWAVTTTDTTAALQAPGAVGVVAYVSGSSTNAPLVVSVDDVTAGPRPAG